MFRFLLALSLVALVLWSCGPDSRTCSGPNFRIVLKLESAPLPADIVVRITYAGSAVEIYRLSDRNVAHKVAFCQVADENGARIDASTPEATGSAGAAGAAGSAGVAGADDAAPDSVDPAQVVSAIYCDLWTGGFTQLEVSGTGFDTVKYELAPKAGLCTVDEPPFVLDSPDAG